jgi:hypothetical protein
MGVYETLETHQRPVRMGGFAELVQQGGQQGLKQQRLLFGRSQAL